MFRLLLLLSLTDVIHVQPNNWKVGNSKRLRSGYNPYNGWNKKLTTQMEVYAEEPQPDWLYDMGSDWDNSLASVSPYYHSWYKNMYSYAQHVGEINQFFKPEPYMQAGYTPDLNPEYYKYEPQGQRYRAMEVPVKKALARYVGEVHTMAMGQHVQEDGTILVQTPHREDPCQPDPCTGVRMSTCTAVNSFTAKCSGNYGSSVEESCLNGVGGEYCLNSEVCEGKVELANILDHDIGEDNIFFMETSPKEVITPREACSLESAARNSGLHVVMVRAGKVLDKSDNTTCQILNKFKSSVSLYYLDMDKFAEGTLLAGFFSSDTLEGSMSKFVHSADALRLLLLHRYGGFYADSDFVILKDLTQLKNVIASDQVARREYSGNHLLVGHTVSNAMFHFSRGSLILTLALNHFHEAFSSQVWASGGPDLLQRCLLTLCGFGNDVPTNGIMMTRERFNSEKCKGISVLDYKSFFPYGWMQQERLMDRKTKSDWYKIFDQSYAVHFYHSSSRRHKPDKVIKRPKYYGAKKPAYLVLGLDHCPLAYWSKKVF